MNERRKGGNSLRRAALIGLGALGIGVGVDHALTKDAPLQKEAATDTDPRTKEDTAHRRPAEKRDNKRDAEPTEPVLVADFEDFGITRTDLETMSTKGLPNADQGVAPVDYMKSGLEHDEELQRKYNALLDQLKMSRDDEHSIHFYIPDDADFDVVVQMDFGGNVRNGEIPVVTMTDPKDGSSFTVLHDYKLEGYDEEQLQIAIRSGLQKVIYDRAAELVVAEAEQ
jgi:hypothetical protein